MAIHSRVEGRKIAMTRLLLVGAAFFNAQIIPALAADVAPLDKGPITLHVRFRMPCCHQGMPYYIPAPNRTAIPSVCPFCISSRHFPPILAIGMPIDGRSIDPKLKFSGPSSFSQPLLTTPWT
jgi:hypothetical protein